MHFSSYLRIPTYTILRPVFCDLVTLVIAHTTKRSLLNFDKVFVRLTAARSECFPSFADTSCMLTLSYSFNGNSYENTYTTEFSCYYHHVGVNVIADAGVSVLMLLSVWVVPSTVTFDYTTRNLSIAQGNAT